MVTLNKNETNDIQYITLTKKKKKKRKERKKEM